MNYPKGNYAYVADSKSNRIFHIGDKFDPKSLTPKNNL